MEHHIVTYSFGDTEAVYLRGQWTMHQNMPQVSSRQWTMHQNMPQVSPRGSQP